MPRILVDNHKTRYVHGGSLGRIIDELTTGICVNLQMRRLTPCIGKVAEHIYKLNTK